MGKSYCNDRAGWKNNLLRQSRKAPSANLQKYFPAGSGTKSVRDQPDLAQWLTVSVKMRTFRAHIPLVRKASRMLQERVWCQRLRCRGPNLHAKTNPFVTRQFFVATSMSCQRRHGHVAMEKRLFFVIEQLCDKQHTADSSRDRKSDADQRSRANKCKSGRGGNKKSRNSNKNTHGRPPILFAYSRFCFMLKSITLQVVPIQQPRPGNSGGVR